MLRPPSATHARNRLAPLGIGLLLFAAVVALYSRALGNGFADIDDAEYIAANPMVQAGLTWPGVRWAFTTFQQANWHPLTWLSHMADVALFGTNAAGHHATSFVLHGLNAALLFAAFWRMTRRLGPSAWTAALFAVHPLHVEAVAWAAERKEVLAGLFWMLALLAYARYVERPALGRYALVFACMAAGLLAKPTLVTLPFALLLLDYWPLGRWDRTSGSAGRTALRLVVEKLPLLALSAASSVVTVIAQASGGSLSGLTVLSPARRAANAAVAYVAYLGSAVWPSKLAVFYPYPEDSGRSVSGLLVPLACVAILLAATGLAVHERGRHPYLLTGWLWYAGVLVPMIGIVQVGMQARADRYAYLPMIGIYVAAAWTAADWVDKRPRLRAAVAAAAGAIVAALAVAAWTQIGVWRDARTLYEHALAVTRDNFLAHHGLGYELERRGDLDGAAAEYGEAIRIHDAFARSHNGLGAIHARRGESESAAGRPERAAQEFDRAAAEFARAAELDPRYPEPRFNLARLAAVRGDRTKAIEHLREYLALRPDDERARRLLDGRR